MCLSTEVFSNDDLGKGYTYWLYVLYVCTYMYYIYIIYIHDARIE